MNIMQKQLAVIMLLVVILLGILAVQSIYSSIKEKSFREGYEQASWHMLLHHKAIGKYPSYQWRHTHLYDNLQTIEDIQITLGMGR